MSRGEEYSDNYNEQDTYYKDEAEPDISGFSTLTPLSHCSAPGKGQFKEADLDSNSRYSNYKSTTNQNILSQADIAEIVSQSSEIKINTSAVEAYNNNEDYHNNDAEDTECTDGLNLYLVYYEIPFMKPVETQVYAIDAIGALAKARLKHPAYNTVRLIRAAI